jgi:hypothetical protein
MRVNVHSDYLEREVRSDRSMMLIPSAVADGRRACNARRYIIARQLVAPTRGGDPSS